MKLEVERYGLRIIPETEVEIAWIEEVLRLKKEGDAVPLKRVNYHRLPGLYALVSVREELAT